jgi:hypothetical protein
VATWNGRAAAIPDGRRVLPCTGTVCVCVLGALASAWEFNPWQHAEDTLAERLRRRPAKPMGFPRVGSNPTGVDIIVID